MVKRKLRWQSYWKIMEKCREMSCGAELFLLHLFFFFPLQLVSADWDALQQGKFIFNFVILLLTYTRIPCSTTHLLLKQMRQQNLHVFHQVLCTISLGGNTANRLAPRGPLQIWQFSLKKGISF